MTAHIKAKIKNFITRNNELVVHERKDEVLIYDLVDNKAHQLNQTIKAVWRNCDGMTSIPVIARKENLPEEYVAFAVEKLQKANLMKNRVDLDIPSDTFSRRKILLKVGATAVALPLIATMIAPMAVHAQSCLGFNQSFDITSSPFFADATACVNSLIAQAVTTCCSGTLNPGFGSIFSPGTLCRGFCG